METSSIQTGALATPGVTLGRSDRPRDKREAAEAFESLFLEQLLAEMRKSVPEGGLFKKGFAEQTFEGMLDRTYAGLMAARGGVGLADQLMRAWGTEEPGGEAATESATPAAETTTTTATEEVAP